MKVRFFFGIKPESNLLKTWSHTNDATLILLPEEVVRTSIDCLDFPRNLILVEQIAALPNPAANTVFCTQGFVDEGLLIECFLQVLVPDTFFNFALDD